jgi:hypothetical protein
MRLPENKKVRCSACGSIKNVVWHHISYVPELRVPLCQSCHNIAHHSKIPARNYSYPFDRDKKEKNNFLLLKGYVIGELIGKKVRCWICPFYENRIFSSQKAFIRHLVERHAKDREWEKQVRLPSRARIWNQESAIEHLDRKTAAVSASKIRKR